MEIINEFKSPLQLLVENKPSVIDKTRSVLDIGCSLPTILFECKINLNAQNLVGVDKSLTQQQVIEEAADSIYSRCENFKRCYKVYLNNYEAMLRRSGYSTTFFDKKVLLKSFDKQFKFYMNHSLEELNINKLGKFDLIILSNILHFVPHEVGIEKTLELTDNLKIGGSVILTINHSNNHSMANPAYCDKIGEDIWKHKKKEETVYLYSDERFKYLLKKLEEKNIFPLFQGKVLDDSTQKEKSLWLIVEKKE